MTVPQIVSQNGPVAFHGLDLSDFLEQLESMLSDGGFVSYGFPSESARSSAG